MLKRVWRKGNVLALLVGMYIDTPTMEKQYGDSLKNLGRTSSPYDPAIPLLSIYPEKAIIERDSYTPMFVAALFTIARTWKQPRCPSTDEWK